MKTELKVTLCVSVIIICIIVSLCLAHDTMVRSVTHCWAISADPNYIDLEVELVFSGYPAKYQRLKMDINGNGQISSSEKLIYTKEIFHSSFKDVEVKIDAGKVCLIPHYYPKLDLFGDRTSGDHPFALKLFFFIRASQLHKKQAVISLKDRLFPNSEKRLSVKLNMNNTTLLEPLDDCDVMSRGLDPNCIYMEFAK